MNNKLVRRITYHVSRLTSKACKLQSALRATCYLLPATLIFLCLTLPQAESFAATLTITASHGSVTVTPDKAQYDYGEVVQLIPKPDTGYCFTGWQGDARGKSLVLNLTMDSDKTIIANFSAWQPPIGIPMPEFGIFETYRMYDDPANRNPALTYTQNAEGGYFTHYIDSTDPNATDTSNSYGSATKPRRTIPRPLPEGSVVEIHNGVAANHVGECKTEGVGTVQRPIFVRGVNQPRADMLVDIGKFNNTSYMIVEGLSVDGCTVQGRSSGVFDTNYVAVRDCNISSGLDGNGRLSAGIDAASTNYLFNVVFYNNIIHDNGIWDPYIAAGDRDIGGIGVSNSKTGPVWVVDNEMYHNEFNGIQVGGFTHHTYVGRNIVHHNKQSGLWTKTAYDVIFSENTSYGHTHSSSDPFGAGLGFQYDPKRVWFLFNYSYDNGVGISCGSGNRGGREEFYFIGNVIHDVTSGFNLNDLNPPEPALLVGNTIYNTEKGIANGYYNSKLDIVNNIIANSTYQVYFEPGYSTSSLSDISYTLLEGPIQILWGTTYTSLAAFQAATGKGVACIEADPQFINAENNDFRLQPTSPAIDMAISSGAVQEAFDRFQELYGIDIRKDFEGNPRTEPWDIGAYEYGSFASVLGDVNNDSEISAYDAALAAQAAVDLITLTPEQTRAADVNGDGEISAYDAALIAQKAVGLIEKFPVEG